MRHTSIGSRLARRISIRDGSSVGLEITSLPDGHIIIGYVAHLKVLDDYGRLYFAMRTKDVNDMEAFGLAHGMVDSIRADLQNNKEEK
jgi:hypothetical protein